MPSSSKAGITWSWTVGELDYIGSAGLGALIGFAKQAREHNGDRPPAQRSRSHLQNHRVARFYQGSQGPSIPRRTPSPVSKRSKPSYRFEATWICPTTSAAKNQPTSCLLQTPGHGSYLAYIRPIVGDLARKVGFDESEVAKIEMAVDEACSNVVKHAYSPDKEWCWQHCDPEIRLDIRTEGSRLVIEINDHGQRFDFANYRPTDMEDHLREMKPRRLRHPHHAQFHGRSAVQLQ